jgi:SAM-dependent methyltransferase
MSELSAANPTGRFTGLADVYARSRPDYPEAAIDFLLSYCKLAPGAVLVDVGCGTGISSRQLARRGLRVIGVEPNAEMRQRAAAERAPEGGPAPVYREGRAEATGLPDAGADAVLAAQAFHWFEPAATLEEFHRILKPCGWAALLWNERDAEDPFTAGYGEVVRNSRDGAKVEAAHGTSGMALLHSLLFDHGGRFTFAHHQQVDEKGLLGRAFSHSYAPREGEAAERFAEAIRGVFRRFEQGGTAAIRYATSLYLARKRDTPG